MSGRLSTHVLDISTGRPAENVVIELWKRTESKEMIKVLETKTNKDGRVDEPLLEGERMIVGSYQLLFHIGDYFNALEGESSPIFNQVPVQFEIANEAENYHIPLLIAPGGYSTYRGS
ncbi:hydroxyisourate hydrolase [Halalkalibacter akibai]|uniref:5-hydroxyisourate hydrolase n=1 Tax=Halalkalibacter akibai (strain ATCC 43226 / DSM 21942 / CIP 109018 / JCM 9157 / 1139) TaxID=1236973 RepID=W4QY39_HALA3|nr:hydroxyisourate hydrolase [Halalkalibacter akibai]GAE37040.1 5-hydroxyisourate hydrolase [Halalkalibacter akibai JCM 9157]